jgi:hypothetical protein
MNTAQHSALWKQGGREESRGGPTNAVTHVPTRGSAGKQAGCRSLGACFLASAFSARAPLCGWFFLPEAEEARG